MFPTIILYNQELHLSKYLCRKISLKSKRRSYNIHRKNKKKNEKNSPINKELKILSVKMKI